MTQAQFESWVKTTLGIIGSVATTYGVGNSNVWAMVSGVAIALIPFVWGYLGNTKLAQVQQISQLPEVEKVVLKPSAGNGLAIAAADPSQPKITK